MSTYVIGDIQGCYDELMSLLALVGYSSEQDALWLAGDLINRGPENVGVMKFCMKEPNCQVVLKPIALFGDHRASRAPKERTADL